MQLETFYIQAFPFPSLVHQHTIAPSGHAPGRELQCSLAALDEILPTLREDYILAIYTKIKESIRNRQPIAKALLAIMQECIQKIAVQIFRPMPQEGKWPAVGSDPAAPLRVDPQIQTEKMIASWKAMLATPIPNGRGELYVHIQCLINLPRMVPLFSRTMDENHLACCDGVLRTIQSDPAKAPNGDGEQNLIAELTAQREAFQVRVDLLTYYPRSFSQILYTIWEVASGEFGDHYKEHLRLQLFTRDHFLLFMLYYLYTDEYNKDLQFDAAVPEIFIPHAVQLRKLRIDFLAAERNGFNFRVLMDKMLFNGSMTEAERQFAVQIRAILSNTFFFNPLKDQDVWKSVCPYALLPMSFNQYKSITCVEAESNDHIPFFVDKTFWFRNSKNAAALMIVQKEWDRVRGLVQPASSLFLEIQIALELKDGIQIRAALSKYDFRQCLPFAFIPIDGDNDKIPPRAFDQAAFFVLNISEEMFEDLLRELEGRKKIKKLIKGVRDENVREALILRCAAAFPDNVDDELAIEIIGLLRDIVNFYPENRLHCLEKILIQLIDQGKIEYIFNFLRMIPEYQRTGIVFAIFTYLLNSTLEFPPYYENSFFKYMDWDILKEFVRRYIRLRDKERALQVLEDALMIKGDLAGKDEVMLLRREIEEAFTEGFHGF